MSGKTSPKRRLVVLQPSYLPWIGYFDLIHRSDEFLFFDNGLFTKNDSSNRTSIKTPKGIEFLTLPVRRGKRITDKLKIIEAKIAEPEIVQQHLKTIVTHYRNAKYFDEVYALLESLMKKKTSSLCDLCISVTKELCLYLGMRHTAFHRSSAYTLSYTNPSDHLIQFCKKFHATHYLADDAAQGSLDEMLFKKNGITVEYHRYKHPTYSQLWGKFIPNLSMVDLLMNHGKKSVGILKSR